MLKQHGAEVREERSARKAPLSDTEVARILAEADEVLIVKGKKVLLLPAGMAKVDDLKGPTGKYRAPMVRHGSTLLVGWNGEALAALIR